MKVGVDARLLSRPLTGIGRYTLEMCQALCKIESISLYLYSPSPIDDRVVSQLPNAKVKVANWNNGVLRQLWSESLLPFWANQDKVDVFWGPAHRLPNFLPKKALKIVTIHDLVWKHASETMSIFTRILERFFMPLAIHNADHIIADSNATATAIDEAFNVDPKIISVVLLGISLADKAEPFENLRNNNIDGPYFLFVGTLEPRKNLTRLLEAYSNLSDTLKAETSLVIAGGKGWGGVDVKKTIADLGLEAHVYVLGYVDESTLATLYAHALFLAMPSIYEGFGLPLVEAMAHGTPVLTSNNSSMPEVAGNAGLLVNPLDTNSIKNGLEQLLTDTSLRNSLAHNTQKQITLFNWDNAAHQLASTFENALREKGKNQQ